MKNKLIPCILFSLCSTLPLVAQNAWPTWRGPNLNGTVDATDLPSSWSESQNIQWKAELPSWSASTPVVWGDRLFVISPSDPGEIKVSAPQPEQNQRRGRRRRQQRHPGGQDLLLLCLDAHTGKQLWQHKLDNGNRSQYKQNKTSPSPITDGKYVWTVTGNGVVTALSTSGKVKWTLRLQEKYGAFGLKWGYASSPILHNGTLMIQVLHGKGESPSYLLGLDARSGEVKWRVSRKTDAIAEARDSYTTPVLLNRNNKTELLVLGGDYITGHEPGSGEELWRIGGLNPEKRRNYRVISSPVVAGNMLFAPTRKKPLMAIKHHKKGVEKVWQWEGPAAPDVPTPVSDGERLYLVDDRGLVVCVDARSGETVWGPERTAQGNVSSSPVLADGKIYFINEQAETIVLAAGTEYKLLSANSIDGGYTLASPAIAHSRIYLRTENALYCIADQDAGTTSGSY